MSDSAVPQSPACDDVRRRAFEYLDGALDDVSAFIVQRHLVMCAPCRDAVQHDERFLKAVQRAGANELSRHPCPTSLRQKVQALLADRAPAPRPTDH